MLLRPVEDPDVDVFHAHQADPAASALAGVPSRDRAAHDAHWRRIRADPETVIRTVVVDGVVAGQVLSFRRDGRRELGYWLGREFWGRGLAGAAVAAFLPLVPQRPLHAVVAPHNTASVRVLERLGFTRAAPDGDVLVFRLDAPAPFTAADHLARMRRAAGDAAEAGLDGLLVAPGPDLAWLAGYRPPLTERLTLLVLRAGRPPALVVPALERGDAAAAPAGAELELVTWRDGDDPYRAAAALLAPGGRYGVADATWALHLLGLQNALPRSGYRALSDCLPMLRAVKDERELARLAAAGAAADAAYGEILRAPFAGRREADVAADLAALLRRFGHEQVDFTIVGSGPNGADPHHGAGDRVIEPGDAVVLDFGGLMHGYGSDTTRTVVVGDPPAELPEVHAIVRRAQQAAFEAVRPGVSCQDVDRVARRVITEAGYGEWFVHRTGHGIGVTTHEPPYLVEGEEQPLVPGMCFSIEPGIYLPGRFGVRIEDIVTVTADGGRRLNTTGHELATVS